MCPKAPQIKITAWVRSSAVIGVAVPLGPPPVLRAPTKDPRGQNCFFPTAVFSRSVRASTITTALWSVRFSCVAVPTPTGVILSLAGQKTATVPPPPSPPLFQKGGHPPPPFVPSSRPPSLSSQRTKNAHFFSRLSPTQGAKKRGWMVGWGEGGCDAAAAEIRAMREIWPPFFCALGAVVPRRVNWAGFCLVRAGVQTSVRCQ